MIALLLLLFACGGEDVADVPASTPAPLTGGTLPEAIPESEWPDRVAARHLLVSYQGANSSGLNITRSPEEARALAEGYAKRARAGEDLGDLAARYSDGPTSRRRGFLGAASFDSWDEAFSRATFSLPVGEIAGPVETPFGFHVIERMPLDEVRLLHIVVMHQGSPTVSGRPPPDRSLDEARARAAEARAEVESGREWAEVAAEFSDGPMGKRGGDLGVFARGELGPAFDAEVFALAPGEISAGFETRYGVHVVRRLAEP